MAERPTVTQTVQIGVETDHGTAVPANRRLQSISVGRPNLQGDLVAFTPEGVKLPALSALQREWVEAPLTGRPTYDEIVYPLSSIVSTPTITTPTEATTGRQWVFSVDNVDPQEVRTFTVERGDENIATKFAYGLVTALNMNVSSTTLDLGGTLSGQALITSDVTMTASPTVLPLIPMLPGQFNLYLDDTGAEIGDTQWLRGFEANISISNRFSLLWVLNRSIDGFAAHVEMRPELTLTIVVGADATGMALFETMRTGAKKFIRLEAVGPVLEAADPGPGDVNYHFQLDMAGLIDQLPSLGDVQEYETLSARFHATPDATWGKSFEMTVVNSLAAL